MLPTNAKHLIRTTEQSETEPIRLAIELEQARSCLSVFLMDNPYSARVIAEQLAIGRQKSGDYFGVPCGKTSIYSMDSPSEKSLDITEQNPQNQHLLPLFLIKIAGLLARHPANDSFTINYKRKLEKYRLDLQVDRQKMISANLGLVAFVADKYTTSNLGFDDLMQEGILGLIKAVDRFDPYRGICFSTYGVFWIKQAISRLIFKQDKIVRLPVPLAEKAYCGF